MRMPSLGEGIDEINVVPVNAVNFVDIIFNLLIFFMALARFGQEERQLDAILPDAASAAFSQAAELALTALDRIASGLPLPDSLKKLQTDALASFETQAHKSQLAIPVIAAFQKLIEASANGGICTAGR